MASSRVLFDFRDLGPTLQGGSEIGWNGPAPSHPRRMGISDRIVAGGSSSESNILDGMAPSFRHKRKFDSSNQAAQKYARQGGLPPLRRTPVGLNVPMSSRRSEFMIDMIEYLPASNSSTQPPVYSTITVDNEITTGVTNPTQDGLYANLCQQELLFVERTYPRVTIASPDVVVLRTLNYVNMRMYNHPKSFQDASAFARHFAFLGLMDGVVVGAKTTGFGTTTSLVNVHVGGEGKGSVQNIWLSSKERLCTGSMAFLLLVRKEFPGTTTSLLLGGGSVPGVRGERDDGDESKLRAPPEGCRHYWALVPYATNFLRPFQIPDSQLWNGPGWTGAVIRLGPLSDVTQCETGRQGKFDNSINKFLFPHEPATHHQGPRPTLPKCRLNLMY